MRRETEARLTALAERTHRPKDELLEEAVAHLIAYGDWLEGKVAASREAAERGQVIADEDVRAWIEKRERS
jgi:predicted transcriptional regulator